MRRVCRVVKDSAFEELNQAVRTVMQNRPYLSAAITGSLVEDFVRQACAQERPAAAMQMLTTREQEVLRLKFQDGLKYREIAAVMGVSVSSVSELMQRAIVRLTGALHE